jgi:hypothetical protein
MERLLMMIFIGRILQKVVNYLLKNIDYTMKGIEIILYHLP